MAAAAALVILALISACGGNAAEKDPGGPAAAASDETVREHLSQYIDQDTRIIYTQYEGIEEDIESYQDDRTEEMTEENRRSWAEYKLQQTHVETEFQEAFRSREETVCVVGWLNSLNGYVNSRNELAYDNGVFRSMPYSSFWVKSSEEVAEGFLPADGSAEKAIGDRYYVYKFEYYPLNDDLIEEMEAAIDHAADEIIACVPQDADLWETCRIVHDELIRRTEYDYDFADHCHDLYGALVSRKCVCEGYALAFRFILNRMGEDCDVIVSTWDEKPDSTTHAWNQISGNTYERYIDVTWDDTGYIDENGEPYIEYGYFGLTKEEIETIEEHAFDTRIKTVYSDPRPFNYYRHEGYLMSSFDEQEMMTLYARQYQNGSHYLTVRFDNREAFQEACDAYKDINVLNELMYRELEYEGEYWYRWDDEVYTFSVGLGPLPEEPEKSAAKNEEETGAYINGESEFFHLIYSYNKDMNVETDRELIALYGWGEKYYLVLNADGTGIQAVDGAEGGVVWDEKTLSCENGAVFAISREGDVITLENDSGIQKYELGDASNEEIPVLTPVPHDPGTRAGYYRLSVLEIEGTKMYGQVLEKKGMPVYLVLNEDQTGYMTKVDEQGGFYDVRWDDTNLIIGEDQPLAYSCEDGTIGLELGESMKMTLVYAGTPGEAPA